MDETQVRLLFLLGGVLLGWGLGAICSHFRNRRRARRVERGDAGVINLTTVGMIAALIVVVASLFSTLSTNRQVADTQDQLAQNALVRDRENQCTATILFGTIEALNQRTTYTGAVADANINLQEAQLRFLRVVSTGQDGDAALDEYVEALSNFIRVTAQQKGTAKQNPYPTQGEYATCLEQARDSVQE